MITLSDHPYLFVDNTLVEKHEGASLRLHHPRRENVAFAFDAPWEGPNCTYCSVVDCGAGSSLGPRYRLYYRGTATGTDLRDECTCVAESEDGVVWTRRPTWKFLISGSLGNNAVWLGEHDISHNMAPFLDANPDAAPAARFKAVGGVKRKGLFALSSPDGISWSVMQDAPVMTEGDFDSLNLAFWDVAKGCYTAYIRQGREGKRSIRRCQSDDFIRWSAPEWLDFGDGPLEHFYTNAIQPYPRDPHLYLGFPMRFAPERTPHPGFTDGGTGVSDCVLIASRDGLNFPRAFRQAFVRPGLDRRTWTHRNFITATGLVRTAPTEYSLYWVEHYAQHDCHLRRGTVRVDGFASLHADWPGGEATSNPVRLEGGRLVLNVATSAAGGVSIEIQDASGQAVPGFALDECDEVYGDEIERTATWRGSGDLSRLKGEAVRLRFALTDADVYSVASVD